MIDHERIDRDLLHTLNSFEGTLEAAYKQTNSLDPADYEEMLDAVTSLFTYAMEAHSKAQHEAWVERQLRRVNARAKLAYRTDRIDADGRGRIVPIATQKAYGSIATASARRWLGERLYQVPYGKCRTCEGEGGHLAKERRGEDDGEYQPRQTKWQHCYRCKGTGAEPKGRVERRA